MFLAVSDILRSTMNRERHNDITDQLQDLSHAIWNVKKSLSSRNYQGFSRDPLTVDVKDYLTFVDEVEVEMHPPNLFEDDQEGKFLPVTGPTAPSRDLEEIEATPHDNVRGNKETLDWLRKNGFSTENLEVSRPKALRLAVREGQVAVLHGLVNQVSRTPARRALLADATDLAVSIGQLDVLQSLITTEGGLNIDSHLESGHTPLIAAITAGNHQTIECLLRHGADTEARCAQEITPLTHAVIARDQGIVQFLLHGKAHIDAKTWDWTPLHFAVDHGDREMVDQLLKNHANIEASCPRDFSQKTYTQPTGLERPIAVPSTEEVKRYCTPLFRASINEEDMMVHLLLERGANPEAKNSGQATALICAAEEQFEEIVELLLRYKARVDARDQWEWTPLHRAQVKQESELVTKLLLDYKADVEARCQKQRTPLHGAAEWGNTRTVPILLEYKADIEAKDSAERTPLHVAIEYRQTEMVIQLVKHGADVMARNGDGHHALAAAVHVEMQRRCPEIIAFLEEEDKKRTKRGKEGKEGKEEKEDEKKEEKTEDAQSSNGFKHPHPLV